MNGIRSYFFLSCMKHKISHAVRWGRERNKRTRIQGECNAWHNRATTELYLLNSKRQHTNKRMIRRTNTEMTRTWLDLWTQTCGLDLRWWRDDDEMSMTMCLVPLYCAPSERPLILYEGGESRETGHVTGACTWNGGEPGQGRNEWERTDADKRNGSAY